MKIRKEQQQVIMLGAVLLIIAGVLVYGYGSRFLPSPQGTLIVPPTPVRLLLPSPDTKGTLYERDDFKSLREVPGVPLRPMPTDGTPDPFQQPQAPTPVTK